MNAYDEERSERGSTWVIVLVAVLVALLVSAPQVMARGGSARSAKPIAGLPAGHPVIGSVNDGVKVPYRLDLKGRSSARVTLTIDGRLVADVSNASASGTVSVPARSPLLAFDENAQLAVVAKAPDGTVLDSATGVASISDGVRLPTTLASYWPQVDLADGDQRTVVAGQAMRFLGSVTSGSASIPLTSYDLRLDGTSILSTAPQDCAASVCGGTQWIDGSWTPPKTAGNHQLVLLASAAGDSRVIKKTYTLTVLAESAFRIDKQSVVVDPAVGWHLNTLLRRVSDYAPIPGAPVSVWRSTDNAATWTKVRDGSTDASGVFDTMLFPDKSGLYKLTTPGVAGLGGPSESAFIDVEVNAKVVLTASRTSVTLPSTRAWSTTSGTSARTLTFTISGPVGMAGNAALLQLWNGQTWNTVAWGKIGPNGSMTVSYRLRHKRGDYKFGVVTGRNEAYAPTVSNEVHVDVR